MTHLCTTRNPMSEARRNHVHGKVQPMDEARPSRRRRLLVIGFAFAVLLYFTDRVLAGWWA